MLNLHDLQQVQFELHIVQMSLFQHARYVPRVPQLLFGQAGPREELDCLSAFHLPALPTCVEQVLEVSKFFWTALVQVIQVRLQDVHL